MSSSSFPRLRAEGACEVDRVALDTVPNALKTQAQAVAQMLVLDGHRHAPNERGDLWVLAHRLEHATVNSYRLLLKKGDFANYAEQLCIAASTAVLVGPRLVLTAGHCIDPSAIEKTYFVFGRTSDEKLEVKDGYICFPKAQIARGVRLREKWNDAAGLDFAFIEVDAAPEGVKHLNLAARTGITDCVVLGHPLGLPMKAARSKVSTERTGPSAAMTFHVSTDSGGGASGCPIIVGDEIVGIMRGSAKVSEVAYVTHEGMTKIDLSRAQCAEDQSFTSVDAIHQATQGVYRSAQDTPFVQRMSTVVGTNYTLTYYGAPCQTHDECGAASTLDFVLYMDGKVKFGGRHVDLLTLYFPPLADPPVSESFTITMNDDHSIRPIEASVFGTDPATGGPYPRNSETATAVATTAGGKHTITITPPTRVNELVDFIVNASGPTPPKKLKIRVKRQGGFSCEPTSPDFDVDPDFRGPKHTLPPCP